MTHSIPQPDEKPIEYHLPSGEIVLISPEDADLATLRWRKSGKGYAVRHKPRKETGLQIEIYMHRAVLVRKLGRELIKGEIVDHINRNGFDNRRENLRLANLSQNAANQKRAKKPLSGYRGVSWHHENRKWIARICVNGKHIRLGYFDDPKEAHEAYKVAAIEHFDKFARFE